MRARPSFGRQIVWTLVGVLLVYMIFYIGILTRNSIKQYDVIGQADQIERTITINGTGKVNAANDIAVTTISHTNTDMDVGKAQMENKKIMDQAFADLKKLGIADKDLQSNYSINPQYNYTQDKGQQLVGYEVRSSITVKIRDLTKISDVLNLAGKYGANGVSGLNFTIDDPENLKDQARRKAVADAEKKAVELSSRLGVRLVAVMSYVEFDGGTPSPMAMYKDLAMNQAMGMGGGGAPEQVAAGSHDVTMNVSITYKIMP
jgi:uncharacterized protein YggE